MSAGAQVLQPPTNLRIDGIAVPAPAPAPASAPCGQTLAVGSNVRAAVLAATNGTTICLNAGEFGAVDLSGITKSEYVTLRSTSGKTASASFSMSNSSFVRLQNLTINKLNMWQGGNRNVAVLANAFTGQFMVVGSGSSGNPANVLIDGNTFDGISVGPNDYEGRLQIYNGGGVTVSNNHFGRGGESDGIQMGGFGGTIGPGNVFEDLVYTGGRHVDAIQLYGEVSNPTIVGNFFIRNVDSIMAPDGGNAVTIKNNVFVGNNISYGEIQLGSQINPVFTHNVVLGMAVGFDKKSESPTATTNALVRDNIFAMNSRLGVNCSGCTFTQNLFDSTSIPYGSANMSATPKFVGGGAFWGAYLLRSDSPGYKAAADGSSLGIN